MRRILPLMIIFILIYGCSPSGNTKNSVNTLTPNTQSSGVISNTPQGVSVSPNLPQVRVCAEMEKLQSLEKRFNDSAYHQVEKMILLTMTKDDKYIAYKTSTDNMEDKNQLILTGMPQQMIDLYYIDLDKKQDKKLGKTGFIISHAWSLDHTLLSLVSKGSVKILDTSKMKISDVPLKYEKDRIYNANWDRSGNILYIHLDTTANYYSYDFKNKKFLKIRGNFTEEDIVFRGRVDGNDLISKGEHVGVASGLYREGTSNGFLRGDETIIHDIYNDRILISSEHPSVGSPYYLEDLNINTGESRIVNNDHLQIYKASYLKTQGKIIYTTFEISKTGVKYLLVIIGSEKDKTVIEVPSPLYIVTPGETNIHFATFTKGERCMMDTRSFSFIDNGEKKNFKNSEIRDLMYRAIGIYASETPDISEINQIFVNTYDPIPQEALENITLEAQSLGSWKYTRLKVGKELTMAVKFRSSDTASVSLEGVYFRDPHELIKRDGKWYITGFSTWPGSKERDEVSKVCSQYIKNKLKLKNAEIGEIEFWATSEPHRASFFNNFTNEARVKVTVTEDTGVKKKYQLHLSRRIPASWKCSSYGELSPGLYPKS